MLLAQLVEQISGIKTGVVGKLAGDDLKSLGKGADQKLLFSGNCASVIAQVFANFHLDGTTTSNDGVGLSGSADDHDSVVQRTVSFLNKHLTSSTKNDGCGMSFLASSEQVVTVSTNLTLLESCASSENCWDQVVNSGLDGSTSGTAHTAQVLLNNTTSAENIAISEVLCGNITCITVSVQSLA